MDSGPQGDEFASAGQQMEDALAVQLTRLAVVGLVALVAATQPLIAAEPTVAGLWQKTDAETGKPVIWFLFHENGATYEGVAAKLFPLPTDGPSVWSRNSRWKLEWSSSLATCLSTGLVSRSE